MTKDKISFLLVVIFLAAVPFIANAALGEIYCPPMLSYGVLGLGIMSILVDRYLLKAERERPQRYIAAFMGTTSIKLFSTVGFISIALYLCTDWNITQKVIFALGMFAVYMAFVFYQIIQHNKRLKANKTQD